MKSYAKSGATGMRKPGPLPTPGGAKASPDHGANVQMLATNEPGSLPGMLPTTRKYTGVYLKQDRGVVSSPYERFDLNGVPKL